MTAFEKIIPITRILFDGDTIPYNRVQLAHSQITGYHQRKQDNVYALDQSKWSKKEGYFMMVYDNAISRITSLLTDKPTTRFYHEKENYQLTRASIEFLPWTESRIGQSNRLHFYSVDDWCPFDQDDHKMFKNILQGESFSWKDSFFEQRQFLDQLLRKHLFALTSRFYLDTSQNQILANFFDLWRVENRWVNHFNDDTGQLEAYPMWAFSGSFAANILIPPYTGIGRSVRYSNGIVHEINSP